MNVPQIRLQSISAQIGIHTIKGQQTIQQKPADISIQQPKAELSIETIPSRLTIDQTQAWTDMDLKHISRRIEEAAQQGYQDWLAGISRRMQEGKQLRRIQDGGNAFAAIAKKRSAKPIYPFNIGFIPSAGSVKMSYEPAKVNIDVRPNKPNIDVSINKPIIDYQPGNVEIEHERRNDLTIDFVEVGSVEKEANK
jgi:hypothetical protein